MKIIADPCPKDIVYPDPTPTPSAPKRISIGDIFLDMSEIDRTVERLERALAAFKAEWNKK